MSDDSSGVPAGPARRPRPRTGTSAFGVSRREGHDATRFYERFPAPSISTDVEVVRAPLTDILIEGDSRDMHELPDKCAGLICTSPPYFAAKVYEEDVSKGHVPSSYIEYLEILAEVFAECMRVLEPGGRMAINVANLGRRPYRSLSRDVARILEEDLGLFPMGEILWIKAEGAGGSCAFGSYRKPSAPVLRDVSERILVFGKGGPARVIPWKQRRERGLPWEATIPKEDFLSSTLDVWRIQPESAKRVGHPAPFPVELPRRLIELYTWRGDLVVDPFAGVASTGVAAVRTDRRFVGYDTELEYLATGVRRLNKEAGGEAFRFLGSSERGHRRSA